jgi:hypothetical protein
MLLPGFGGEPGTYAGTARRKRSFLIESHVGREHAVFC